MLRILTLVCSALVICLVLNTSVAAQEAFLRKGTIALNPDDEQTLFLYVPGYTLLYNLGTIKGIRSRAFGDRENYQIATTQDGIRVLVRVPDIRKDVEALEDYDFLVNRRMPFCETAEACNNIWGVFTTVTDEGLNWSALWARTAGKFTGSENSDSRSVRVLMGGAWDEGFIPSKRNGLRLEDSGFITVLHRQYPAYQLEETINQELASPCTHEQSQKNIVSLLNKAEAYAKASVGVGLDVAASSRNKISKNLAKALLSFLGLEANISVEAFVDGEWKRETAQKTTDNIIYGDKDQEWQVKFVEIHRRSDSSPETYRPFASAIIRKVLQCSAGQPTEMTFASYFLTLFPEDDSESPAPIRINLDANSIEELKLENEPLDRGLVSINRQTSHHKLLDSFIDRGVPKSIANLFIKEINVTEARR